ncbi:MAG: hypothetical protein PHE84_03280 [bacterium]|nr:hypothetical protein [bacterium]
MIKKILNWFFATPQESRSWWQIIVWWEFRRIPYNIFVALFGSIGLSLYILFLTLAKELKPGEDFIEPMALFITPFLINIAYSAGWIGELVLRIFWKQKSNLIGPSLLKLGVSFSIVAIFLPALLWFVIWIKRTI